MTVIQCNRNGSKFPCGIFSCNLRFRFGLFWTVITTQQPMHRRQHWRNQQHNEDNTYYNQTQTNTNTSPISRTDTGPLHSKWHEVCTVMKGQLFRALCEHVRPTRNGPRSMHSGPQGKSELCVQRAIIVVFSEREEREDKRGKRKRTKEENDGREKERREERKREKRTPPHTPSLLSVCRFKTSPCVGSKRFRVYWQNARMLNTCGRLLVHTEAFWTYTRFFFRVPSRATHRQHNNNNNNNNNSNTTPRTHTIDTTHHTLHTYTTTNTTHNGTAQHTTTPKYQTHIPHTLSAHTPHRTHHHTHHNTHTHCTSVTIPQFYRITKFFVGCWIENGRTTCFGLVGCGVKSGTFIE